MNTTLNKIAATFAALALCIALAITAVPLSHAEDNVQNHPVVLPDGSQGGILSDLSGNLHGQSAKPDYTFAETDIHPLATGIDCTTYGINNTLTHINLAAPPTVECETTNWAVSYNSHLGRLMIIILNDTQITFSGELSTIHFVVSESQNTNIVLDGVIGNAGTAGNGAILSFEIETTIPENNPALNINLNGYNQIFGSGTNFGNTSFEKITITGTGNLSLTNGSIGQLCADDEIVIDTNVVITLPYNSFSVISTNYFTNNGQIIMDDQSSSVIAACNFTGNYPTGTGIFAINGTEIWVGPPINKIPIYRAAKLQGGYFYTSNLDEYKSAVNFGMRLESGDNGEDPAFYATDANTPGAVPIYRSAKLSGDGYFYTADPNEHATTPQYNMRQESTDFYVMPVGSRLYHEIPLYRGAHQMSHGNGNQGYIYTANWHEYTNAFTPNGYRHEGEVFRVFAGGAAVP